jgi:hypothetical protein
MICKKELPADSKLPICDYHAGLAREKAVGIGTTVTGVGIGAYVLVKKYGKDAFREGIAIAKTFLH